MTTSAWNSAPVSAADVLRVFGEKNERLRRLLHAVIPRIGPQPDDLCSQALDGARVGSDSLSRL
jgi:hypothetical protein